MKKNKSKILLYGLIVGGIIGAGVAVYLSSRYVIKKRKDKKERKHKFFEGLDDIFDTAHEESADKDLSIDKETEDGIIDELFSKNN